MNAYRLPVTVPIGGRDFVIRSDFRVVLDVLMALNDPDLDDEAKGVLILQCMYPRWNEIPPEHVQQALQAACDFIDCMQADDGKHKPRTIDWEQDAALIIPSVNKVAHMEVRSLPYLHWWTFFGYFMEIGEGLLSNVLSIRIKKATHKKLDKWEQEFYRDNKSIIDLRTRDSEEVREEKESILAFLD